MDTKITTERKAILDLCRNYALHYRLWTSHGFIISEVKAHEYGMQLHEIGINFSTAMFLGESETATQYLGPL